MSSGVQVSSECLATYQQLKNRQLKYIVFTVNDSKTEIVVEKTGEKTGDNEQSYEEFVAALQGSSPQCRWGVYDLEFEKGDDGKRSKICFFSWAPDDAKIKEKMLFASSKEALRRSFVGIQVEVQGTDVDEIHFDVVLEKAKKGF